MTAGYYHDYRDEFDQQIWEDRYGFSTTYDDKKIGSITPQNIGSFKITDIGLTETEKQLMFSKTGAELYNKQYELNKDKNYFSPINEMHNFS